jgi:ABC-type nitrate/sulfonate/bicarbonate transport system permease component
METSADTVPIKLPAPASPVALLARFWRHSAGTAITLVLILAAWFVGSLFLPEYIFPGIGQVGRKFATILSHPATYGSIVVTLQRIVGGFVLSSVFGIALGILLAMNRPAHTVAMPALKMVAGVPALTWVLLSIIWFKSTELRVWFITFVLAFPIVATNTYDGVRSVPADLYQMVQALRPSRTAMLRLLIIPSAMPFIFSGLRVSLSFGGRIAVFAEALSASSGIGADMYTMDQMFDTAGIVVWTVLLVLLLTSLDLVLSFIERRWFRWRVEAAR